MPLPASLIEAILEIDVHDIAVARTFRSTVHAGCGPLGRSDLGLGLGNARFSNRRKDKDGTKEEREKSKD